MILHHSLYRGIGLLGVLLTLTLFSFVILIFSQWQNHIKQQANYQYQFYQALQIAHNQQQRLFLGLPCQHHIEQNQFVFTIECQPHQVNVQFLLGRLSLSPNLENTLE